jgi:hypothetical protein
MSSTQQLLLGEGAGGAIPAYIEEVFSTWLYTGNGSTQTITNGIDLSTKGGLVWIKIRGTSVQDHALYDTARTARYKLSSNLTSAQVDTGTGTDKDFASFNSTGFSLGTPYYSDDVNGNSYPYASWTFRKQAKFFDIVTYSGTGSAQTIAHNLGSVPGCIIIKSTSTTSNWAVYHRSIGNTGALVLNSTATTDTSGGFWNDTSPTSTNFTVRSEGSVNFSGRTYVAYLFAHDAGGFGLTGTDNVISCGSYTGTGSNVTVNLGYEPQWLLLKDSTSSDNWELIDTMRGWPISGTDNNLRPNSANAESSRTLGFLTSTGFVAQSAASTSSSTYIYIAIRRGPMKVPTVGTSVFAPIYATASAGTTRTVGFTADLLVARNANSGDQNWVTDRLRGFPNGDNSTQSLYTTGTAAEVSAANYAYNVWNTTAVDGSATGGVPNTWSYFGRAPSFFDVVCYTGNTTVRTLAHNLGAIPELMIVKRRNGGAEWFVYNAASGATRYLWLNSVDAQATLSTVWNNTAPTSSVFTVGANSDVNGNGDTYVNYLFATCAGVSKVGSYTGTGALQTVNCGFTSGARFVLIKRTDSTGDWFTYDSARGITSGNDPYLLWNSINAQVTNTNYVDTTSVGFQVTAAAPAGLNANGGTFIFLAIA